MSPWNETTWVQNLRNLTEQAGRAAVLGQWDQVEECYRLRGMHLRDHTMRSAIATDLAAVDQMVAARIVTARAAVASLLIQTEKVRQNLQGLGSCQHLSVTKPLRIDRRA